VSSLPSLSNWRLYRRIASTRVPYAVEAPLTCGVIMTFLARQSGWPSGSGSGSVTSNAAPRIRPVSNAWIKSSVLMTGPRAILETKVLFLDSTLNSGAEISPVVFSVNGIERTRRSKPEPRNACSSSFESPENHLDGNTPSRSPVPAGAYERSLRDSGVFLGCSVYAWTSIPIALATLAACLPILPYPRIPLANS
jgi:hypothetical protein